MNSTTNNRGLSRLGLLMLAGSLLSGCAMGKGDGAQNAAPAVSDTASDQRPSDAAPMTLELQIAEAAPRATRAGFLRFFDPAFRAPGAQPHIEARAARESSEAVREALAEALMRHPEASGEAALAWLSREPSAAVRLVLVGDARRASLPQAEALITAGLEDASAEVRAVAAGQVARIEASKELRAALLLALRDEAPEVRVAALRAVSALPVDAQNLSDVAQVRLDTDPLVRAAALRAMDRMGRTER